MKITIDLDAASGVASMQSLASVQTEPVPASALATSQAMDAGSYRGPAAELVAPLDAPRSFDAGNARVPATAPPRPHADTLAWLAGPAGREGRPYAGSR